MNSYICEPKQNEMNRKELEKKIQKVVNQNFNYMHHDVLRKDLADLFIELSNERCKEQIENCHEAYTSQTEKRLLSLKVGMAILTAPLPKIQ